MKYRFALIFVFLTILSVARLYPQTADDNIIITQKTETYEFEKSRNGNVTISEKSVTDYLCTQMRAATTVVEFYDDQSSIDKVSVKGIKNVTPKYNLYSDDNIFYSDARVCHFQLNFDRKDTKASVEFHKTYKDPRYFTTIYLSEPLFLARKTVEIAVPDWMNVELIEKNFGGNITKEVRTDAKNNVQIHRYVIENEPAMKTEENMQGRSYIYPHILVWTKSADVNGTRATYFETLDNQYAWYKSMVDEMNNDADAVAAASREIAGDAKTDDEKITKLFSWVQDNIRYVAFEDGIAGFKPDDAQEVIRKKYGDCKGMANLMKELLAAQGFDARLTWLGTNRIAYDYSTPALCVDNHMICALRLNNAFYFLDPTVKYMPFGEYPQTIQGRQVMIENGDGYLLQRIPEAAPSLNTERLVCAYTISGNELIGKAVNSFKGESKQVILSLYHGTPKDKLDIALDGFLRQGKVQDKISDIRVSGTDSGAETAEFSFQIINKSSIQSIDDEYYIGMDLNQDFTNGNIDTAKRVNDMLFPYKIHLVREMSLRVPQGYTVSHLPQNLDIANARYAFSIRYAVENETVTYRKEISVFDPLLKKSDFGKWNADINTLKKCYLEQVVLTKQQ